MIRIVKLTLKLEHVNDFLNHFETVKQDINNFPGCKGMKLLQGKRDNNVLFTYSQWFDAKAEAWSTEEYFDGFELKN